MTDSNIGCLPDGVRFLPVPGVVLAERKSGTGIGFFSRHGFIIGQENDIIEPVILKIIDNTIPAEQLPVVFYGSDGSGRTHLLRGLASLAGKYSQYFTASDFQRFFRKALTERSSDLFYQKCIQTPLLLIDDIEHLAGALPVQNELRSMLDARSESRLPTVIAASAFPGQMAAENQQYNQDFILRLVRGTTIPLFLPALNIRRYFIRQTAAHFRLSLQEAALDTLAEKPYSFQQLYSTVAEMSVKRTNNVASRRKVASDAPVLPLGEICKRTSKYYGCRQSDLRGTSRKKTIAAARSVAVYLAHRLSGHSMTEIAEYFGKRDVTTLRYLVRTVHCRLPKDAALRNDLFQLGLR
jgi:chromosomal replication initiator protein